MGDIPFIPLAVAVAVTALVWLDWTPPTDTSVSHPLLLASATRYSSYRLSEALVIPNDNTGLLISLFHPVSK